MSRILFWHLAVWNSFTFRPCLRGASSKLKSGWNNVPNVGMLNSFFVFPEIQTAFVKFEFILSYRHQLLCTDLGTEQTASVFTYYTGLGLGSVNMCRAADKLTHMAM